MSATFDPYYKWLGIAPKDQPPSHYRLLGLENFESDPQVIEAAADRQLGFLRKFQSGEHAADCQKLLNEVSRARLCLLKPASKAAYDAELRDRLDGGNEFSDIDFAEESPDAAVSSKRRSAKSGRLSVGGMSIPIPVAIGGGLLVVLIAGLIVFRSGPPKSPVPAVPPAHKPVEIAKATPVKSEPLAKTQEQPETVEPEPTVIPPDGSDEVKSKFFGRSRQQRKTSKESTQALSGPVVNVLPLMKDSKYSDGKWNIEADKMEAAGAGTPGCRIALPVPVPAQYTLHVRGTRLESPGADLTSVGVILNCDGHSALFAMDCFANSGSSGLQYVDGREWNDNETSLPGFRSEIGKPFDLDAIVREDGIEVRVDGLTVVDWKGDFSRLSLKNNWKSKAGDQLGVFSAANCVFTQITLGPALPAGRPVASRAKPASKSVPAAPTTTPTAGPPQVEGALASRVIPELPARQALSVKIRERFAAEFADLKKDSDKLALSAKLEQFSTESPGDPVTKYMSLEMAREFAVEAGDVARAFALADKMCSEFDVDAPELQTLLAKALGAKVKGPVLNKELLEKLLPLIDGLKSAERFQQAIELATLAGPVALKAKDKAAQADVNALKKEAEELAKEFAIADAARKTLESSADDAEAKSKWGRWLCLRKGKWDEGLPLLAAGDQAQLKSLAESDLKNPTDQAAIVQLSNDWLSFANSKKDHSEAQFADRAMFWLQQAVEQSSGVEKTKNEQLLGKALEVRDWDSPLLALLNQVEKKVQQRRYMKSEYARPPHGQPFEKLMDPPGFLVGLNYAVYFSGENAATVKAIQPVYFTKLGLRSGDWQGSPEGIPQVIELRARPGYAINGFVNQMGNGHIQISFARVTRNGLDVGRTYQSPSMNLPVHKPEPPVLMTSGTQPIIGLMGHADSWICGYGVIFTQ
ncbi:MAG: hypothetical protein JWN70_3668 [Planctomycetaceae bacterium]|nr:hypothetical protein [Planctomycetaceae bacterium]